MTISTCLIGEMRYVEWRGIGRYDMYFVDTGGVATQIERMSLERYGPMISGLGVAYWCAGCDERFMSWMDAERHALPFEETFESDSE